MFDYSVKFSAIDNISAKINEINAKMASMKSKAEEATAVISKGIDSATQNTRKFSDTIAKANTQLDGIGESGKKLALKGRDALLGGATILAPLGKAVMAYQDMAQAQGEIKSLGIDDAGIKSITKSAMEFSNAWAGTTTADFIRASYDIKSGIATLSDVDVGKFTALAGMTANATKSSTAEMTKLFALGHGIFREQFSSDIEFGNKFSSAISTAVKAFRTDGSDLVTGLSTLGASASAMGVSLQEQLAVIGMSKSAFNNASEGATSYRAFLKGAVNAQEDLGLSFVNSQGKLLPMADIMDKIKGKVKSMGLTMDNAKVQQALTKAFGSDEATKMISALVNKTDELRSSQKMLFDNMQQGTKITEEMALAMQQGKEFELLGQKVQNASIEIGRVFAPMALQLAKIISNVTDKIKAWTEANPKLTQTIAKVAMIAGGILVTLGVLSVVIGVFGMAIGSLSTILTAVKFAFIAVRYATILFNMALWANPITWIVAGIVALIGAIVALIVYWGEITGYVIRLWDTFTGFISSLNLVENGIMAIKSAFAILTAPIQFVIGLIDSFLAKFDIYNKAKKAVVGFAGNIADATAGAYETAKGYFAGSTTATQNATPIDNTNKNHTVIDVNLVATGATVANQKASSTGGRVKLNTGSTGV